MNLHGRLSYEILLICFLSILFACEPIRVTTYPERVYPSRPSSTKPSPAEPSQAKPPQTEVSQVKTPQVDPPRGKGYIETVSSWTSYEDLVRWMDKEFFFDA